MKKSCSKKESKVITIKDVEETVNDKEESLTEEQVLINRKLLESGVDSEGLGWLEKRNIFKTINVSLNSGGSEKSPRTSSRLAKVNTKVKWVENSFENSKKEDQLISPKNENTPKVNKSDSENKNTPKSLSSSNSKKNPDGSVKLNNRRDIFKDAEINGESPKSSKKVHYIKIQVEGDSSEECNISVEDCAEDGKESSLGRKRSSPPEINAIDSAKKPKMDESNNRVPSEEENSLLVESELEKEKQNTPFNLKDIKIIVNECEFRNKKWKETYSKYHYPARWGAPIVKNCKEKWEGKRIPPKLLHRYQKYLSSNNLTNSVFFPKCESGDLNKLNCDLISSQSSTNSEYRQESENNFKDSNDGSFFEVDGKKSGLENNLNVSTSEGSPRMVLRNRNQPRPVMVEESLEDEEYSSDDSDEWFSKQKPNKKQKVNVKNKKLANQNKQLVLKLDKININNKNGNEGGRKNGNNSFTGVSAMGNNQGDGNSKPGPDPDTMVCPICSLRFKKQLIESHATECASKTYKD